MKKHAFTDYLLKRPINHLWVIAVCVFIPMLGWLSSVILGLVTLRKSWCESLFALIVLLAANVGHSYWIYSSGNTVLALLSFAISAYMGGLFLWLIALLKKQGYQWHISLSLSIIVGTLTLMGVYLYLSEIGVFVTHWLEEALVRALSMTQGLIGFSSQVNLAKAGITFYQKFFVENLATYFAGAMIVTFLYVGGIGQLFIASWWERYAFGHTSEFWHSLLNIRMPRALSLVFVAAVILLYTVKIPTLFGVVPILLMAWLFAGLSLAHALCHQLRYGWLVLIVMYVGLIILRHNLLPLLLVLACVDSFVDFRHRCKWCHVQENGA